MLYVLWKGKVIKVINRFDDPRKSICFEKEIFFKRKINLKVAKFEWGDKKRQMIAHVAQRLKGWRIVTRKRFHDSHQCVFVSPATTIYTINFIFKSKRSEKKEDKEKFNRQWKKYLFSSVASLTSIIKFDLKLHWLKPHSNLHEPTEMFALAFVFDSK